MTVLRRVWTLFKAELFHGPKDVVLVMAVVVPVLLALFVNLAFGDIFTDRPRLGIYDQGTSPIVSRLQALDNLEVNIFSTEADLRAAAAGGALDMGFVLPPDFQDGLVAGKVRLKAYIWGESLAKNRVAIPIALADAVRTQTGGEVPAVIESVTLGAEGGLPWSQRLLPLTILLAVFFGGMMIPASSLIHEKLHRTLEALNVTPAAVGEIFAAKGIIGAALAVIMGAVTLAISGSFGTAPWGLMLVLALGAVMAAEIGLVLGAFIRDMNTLFAFWKFGGLLLFGPAFIYMFPQIPEWVGYLFPTYYLIRPVTDLTVMGMDFSQVTLYVGILAVIVLVMGLAVSMVVRRLSTQALRLNG